MSPHEQFSHNGQPLSPLEEKILAGAPLSAQEAAQVAASEPLRRLKAEMDPLLAALAQPTPAEKAALSLDEMAWARWQQQVRRRLKPAASPARLWLPFAAAAALALLFGVGRWRQTRQTTTPQVIAQAEENEVLADLLSEEVGLPTDTTTLPTAGVAALPADTPGADPQVDEAFEHLADEDATALLEVMGMDNEAAPAQGDG